MMLVATMVAFTSCDSDRDSNPELVTPSEFTINNPSVGDALVDLAKSKSVELTWSQPQFTTMNAPVPAKYEVQISSTGSFTTPYDDDADDNTGADYIALDETYDQCKVDLPTADVAKALEKLNLWDEGNVPTQQQVSIRVRAFVQNASFETLSEVTSNNVVAFNAVPYYVVLKSADPEMWYLVGNMFGAKWGDKPGETALPMFKIPDYEYDKKTGQGEINYTNYFTSNDYNEDSKDCDGSGFKIQPASFDWNYGMTGDNRQKGVIIYRNNNGDDGGHIVAPEAGYYTVVMNTKTREAKFVKYEGDVHDYGTIQLSGTFNDWTNTPMLPYNTEGVENHAWYYVMTVAAGETIQFKFKIADSWDTNWGFGSADGEINMSGTCAAGGKNLGLGEGKYVISFNDITGNFSIIQI